MIKESMVFMYFGGDCRDALNFYRTALGADVIEVVTYEEAGMADSDKEKALVMNSTFKLGGVAFCANDVFGSKTIVGNNLSIWLEFDGEESLRETYTRFQGASCKIQSEPEETFWNSVYEKVQDPFGIFWELNYQK